MAKVRTNYNARLEFVDAAGITHVRPVWVDKIRQTHAIAGETHQSLAYSHFYAKNNQPGPMRVEGRVPDQARYSALADFIRDHHLLVVNQQRGGSNLLLTSNTMSFIRMTIPSEGLVVEGLIEAFEASRKRFNVAPPFEFDFRVIKDHGQKGNDFGPSFAKRTVWSINLDASAVDTSGIADVVTKYDILAQTENMYDDQFDH
jgi:hypothetical protein